MVDLMTELGLTYSITKWGGVNFADQADSLIPRSHIPTPSGWQQGNIPAELADMRNLDFHKRGIGKRSGSSFFSSMDDVATWQQVGNDLNISGVTFPALAALSSTRVAYFDSANDELRTYDFDGADWAQTGNSLSISGVTNIASLAALSSTRVAYFDGGNQDLRVYEFTEGTGNWAQVGNDLNITSVAYITALSSTRIAWYGVTPRHIRTYEFTEGTGNWAQVGNSLSVGASAGDGDVATLSSSRIAFTDEVNAELRTYDFDETDWSQTGNGLSVPAGSDPTLAALSSRRVVYINSTDGKLRAYDFDEADWAAIGSETVVSGTGRPAAAGLTTDKIAFIDDSNDDLRTYNFAGTTPIAGIEWKAPSSGTRVQVILTDTTILSNQSGSFTQINDSAGSPYTHGSTVTKGMFVKGDGHLFIFMDGANNEIQVYREGADLDPEMKNGNTYEDAYGAGTHTMTGTWPTGAFMGAYVNGRLCWSDGNTLIEFTPMAQTVNSGIWDLGATVGPGFYRAAGRVLALTQFVPHLSNSIEETLFIGTEQGWEFTTGFLSFDRIVRIQGSTPALNHKAHFVSRNWVVYLTEDKNIMAINRQGAINLGRRFKAPVTADGPLDGMDVTQSDTNSFGFYDQNKEQGYISITTDSTKFNDTWLVLDFKLGEPIPGENPQQYEQRVRCLVWDIGTPATNDWFTTVYHTADGPVGVLQDRTIYTMESGDDDLDTIAISAYGVLPVLTGGNEVVERNKQFGKVAVRAKAAATTTLELEGFENWADHATATPEFTASRLLTADAGDIAKFTRDTLNYAEGFQMKFQNAESGKSFVIQSVKQTYDIQAEQRGA
jgi:hypothetical protein